MPTHRQINTEPELAFLSQIALAAICTLAWLLAHRYFGIYDDAVLYTLQALNRIHPETYANDMFLRFGSQDSFTIFASLFARMVKGIGVTAAGVTLVLACSAWAFVAAWFAARRVMPARLAWLGVGLLAIIPAHYGSSQIFKFAEEFVSARLPAEAALMTALAFFLHGHRLRAWAFVLIGGLIHPLMTLPVAAVILLMSLPEHHVPRVLIAGLGAMVIACLVAVFWPVGSLALMDETWLRIVHLRSNYLFLQNWPVRSFERAILVLTTLAFLYAVRSDALLRSLVRVVILVCAAGLLATLLTQWIPVIIFMQVQPWRTLWIATVLSILTLPLLVHCLWRNDRTEKAAAVLLVCGWLLQDAAPHAMLLAPLALALWLLPHAVKSRMANYQVVLAASVAAVTTAWTAATAYSTLTVDLGFHQEHVLVERLRTMFGLAAAGAVLFFAVWRVITVPGSAKRRTIVAAAVLAASLPLIALATWAQWVAPSLKPKGPDWFIDWKAIVPAGTQVLWLWDPVSTWMLLERPSYFSYAQAAGVVFSRDVAIVAAKRAASLRSLAPPELTLGANFSDENRESPLTLPRLAAICADPDLGFVVSDQKVGIDAPSKEWPTRGNFIHLYDCRAVRSGHQ